MLVRGGFVVRNLQIAILLLAVAYPVTAQSQNANFSTALEWCRSEEESREIRIRGCTIVIQSGQLNRAMHSVALTLRGLTYFQDLQYNKAISDCSNAVNLDASSAFARICLALIHADQSRPEIALRAIGEITPPKDLDHLKYFYLVRAAVIAANDYRLDAIDQFGKYIAENPHFLPARMARATSYIALDDARAIDDLVFITKSQAKTTGDYVQRASALRYLEKYHEALEDISIALAREPGYAAALLERAIIRINIGQSDGAQFDLDSVIRVDSRNSSAHYYRCLLSYKQGHLTSALADCNTAIGLDPRNSDALVLRGLTRLALKDNNGIIDIDNARVLRKERKTRRFFAN